VFSRCDLYGELDTPSAVCTVDATPSGCMQEVTAEYARIVFLLRFNPCAEVRSLRGESIAHGAFLTPSTIVATSFVSGLSLNCAK